MAKKKNNLLSKLRKLKFGETLKHDSQIILRNKFGYSVLSKGIHIGNSPREAYDSLVNSEEDPYDDAQF